MDPAALYTVSIPLLIGIVTAAGGWLAGRHKAKADAQTVVNQGFQLLLEKLQAETVKLTGIVEKQSAHIDKQNVELVELKSEVRALKDTIIAWERHYQGHGPPPDLSANR